MAASPAPDASSAPGDGDTTAVRAPSITLPTGGGAIRGIDEKFAVNPATGSGTMSIPIATSPGRNGFGPQLSLSYDSSAGNGPFGLGWSLSTPSITRKTSKGLPRYRDSEESDVLILSGAEDLVPEFEKDAAGNGVLKDGKPVVYEKPRTIDVDGVSYAYTVRHYRPRIEGLFARIERWTRDDGDVHWRSISRDNITSVYGKTSENRIADPADSRRVFSWLLCESYDDKGNAIRYEYTAEDLANVDLTQAHERNRTKESRAVQRYLKRIKYGNPTPRQPNEDLSARSDWLFEVVFDYGEGHLTLLPLDEAVRQVVSASLREKQAWPVRPDAFSSYRSGFEVRTYRLCRRVLMFHHFSELEVDDYLVRATEFTYDEGSILTFLTAAVQSSYLYDKDTDTETDQFRCRSLPPVEFTYSQVPLQNGVQTDEADILRVQEMTAEQLENLPTGLSNPYQFVDLDGEGLAGILTEQATGWSYQPNLGDGAFGPLQTVAEKPSLAALGSGQQQLLDLAGDGQLDLALFQGATPGFYERTHDQSWRPFRSFASVPNLNWSDPNLRFVDLTGDGHADLLLTEEHVFTWYPSLAEAGFGEHERSYQPWDEEAGPRLVFNDGTQSIYLSDMSGDGLVDLVRIRNGEVCYWPSLGYGRFGARVTMDNAPWFDTPDYFDQRRIRLADIDGSGISDIIYLGRNSVQLSYNQSGNRWSNADDLPAFPGVDNLVNVQVVDLLGNGTACLVWSSPLPGDARRSLRYVDLMNSTKPHLLVRSTNNLGAETQVEYASSTKFYMQDRRDGNPWITRLPFPVHVVEKQTVIDTWRNTNFSTIYSYHHGSFDGIEREFRGFGRVEQTDVESFGTFAAGNAASPYITDDQTLYQPPVKTITWFHTGAFLDREHIMSHFQNEYYAPQSADFTEHTLPEPDLSGSMLSVQEWREALRACKGMMLRQEVYELDVDALAAGDERRVKLFSTAYHNCHIQRLQAQSHNRHAVFLVTESEAITYHYELDLRQEDSEPDPRVVHTLNLNIDEYGNVLQSVAVAYRRFGQNQDGGLPEDTASLINGVQRESHLVYTENRFTDDVIEDDNYRLRLPCEVKTYELKISPPELKAAPYYTLAELKEVQLAGISDDPYHIPLEPTSASPGKKDIKKRLVEHVRMLYFSNDLVTPLALGRLNARALPYETYTLALTNDLLTAVFGDRLTPAIRADLDNAALSGYLSGADLAARFPNADTSGQYWIRSGIAGFATDAAAHFYLPERYIDPFGNVTTLEFDGYDLFPHASTDPVGNRTEVTHFDYRVLAPAEIKDPNQNLSEVAFDILGMPAAMAVKGKEQRGEDGTLKGYEADNLDVSPKEADGATLIRFFTGDYDEAEAQRLLGETTARHLYYLGEHVDEQTGQITYGQHPPCTAGILRERHAAEQNTSPIQVAFEYSDGGGNVLVTKAQAEPEQPGAPLRWIASGKTILNNKGNPVKQYEPYFSVDEAGQPNHRFEEPPEIGITPIIYYDAVGRTVRTEMPDGTFSRVAFSPWFVHSFDANDTVLESQWFSERGGNSGWDGTTAAPNDASQRAAFLAMVHADTPAEVHLDSLGREVVAIAHNRFRKLEGERTYTIVDEKYTTYTELDAEGKPLWVQDARGNRVMEYITPPGAATDFVPCYDIAGNLLYQQSMDAGDHWMLMDSTGQPFYAWDANKRDDETTTETRIYHTTYDELRRPVEQRLQINGGDWQITERFVYGDTLNLFPPRPAGEISEAEERNLRGQMYQRYDSGGLITNRRFDFKGNLVEATRQLTQTYDAPVIDWMRETPAPETFTMRAAYDALSRMTRQENWHLPDPDREPAVYTPQYNERGLLCSETLVVSGKVTDAVRNIEYNAKGQRTRMQYGNGTTTRYDYDPQTFRLRQLRTTRQNYDPTFPNHRSGLADPNVLQQLRYTYDPSGNISEIYDEAYAPVFFKNQQVKPRSRYDYDALYRLIFAEGREHYSASGPPPQRLPAAPEVNFPIPSHNDPNALREYRQYYSYDEVGNIKKMQHVANGGSWTQTYEYAVDSNRLLHTWYGNNASNAVVYEYDTHGNMLNLNKEPEEYRLRWDYRDMIHTANLGGGGRVYYTYCLDKQRRRKRIERNDGTIEERIYLDGMELYRRSKNGTLKEEIETYHLFDGDQRVLIVEDVHSTDNDKLPTGTLYRYQYSNHLGSVGLELNSDADIITYEEYHPYGTTAYQARNAAVRAAAKRYRYTGKERDAETGLSYHRARSYAPWLARWMSADPAGLVDGVNVYRYAMNSPVLFRDLSGTQSDEYTHTGGAGPGGPLEPDPPAPADETTATEDSSPEESTNAQGLPPLPNVEHAKPWTPRPLVREGWEKSIDIAADSANPWYIRAGGFVGAVTGLIPTAIELGAHGVIATPQLVVTEAIAAGEHGARAYLLHQRGMDEAVVDETLASAQASAEAVAAAADTFTTGVGVTAKARALWAQFKAEMAAMRKGINAIAMEGMTGVPLLPDKALSSPMHNIPSTKRAAHQKALEAKQKFLDAGGEVSVFGPKHTVHEHHLFPKADEFASHWKRLNINIEKFKIPLDETTHLKHVHGGKGFDPRGGAWHDAWREFFKANPMATSDQVFKKLESLRGSFGI